MPPCSCCTASSRYIPHCIALSASSPFVQGQDTAFDSARLNSVFAFPLSGRAPCVLTWAEFGQYFNKMTATGVVQGMKDFYWDIRPKPEFGTIEIRVFDTPLSIERAAALAAYVQALGAWFLDTQPFTPCEDDYLVYTFNRFQACRFGLEGVYVDPANGAHLSLAEQYFAHHGHHRPLRAQRFFPAAPSVEQRQQRCPLAARMPGAHAAAGRSLAPSGAALWPSPAHATVTKRLIFYMILASNAYI